MASEREKKKNLKKEDLVNYGAKNITVLDGLEPVRKRPGMYIGSTGQKGLHHCVWEIFDNCIDEHLAGFCTKISVEMNVDGSITIKDNGRGIPVEIHPQTGKSTLETVLTVLHAGGKFGDGGYKVSGGLHGVGVSVVNALSTKLVAEVSRDGKIYRQSYSIGKPLTQVEVVGETKQKGTSITFLPDNSIFETIEFKPEIIKARLFEQACLNKGLKIEYKDNRTGEKEVFLEKEGIKALLKKMNEDKDTITDIMYIKGSTKDNDGVEDIRVEVAFQYIDEFTPENIVGYCNNIATIEGGTHVTGLKGSLTRLVNYYVEELNLNKKQKLEGRDIQNGFTCAISIQHLEPQFEGQTKTKLGNTDARSAVNEVFFKEGQFLFDKNIECMTTIIEQAIKAQNKRKKDSKNAVDFNSKEVKASVSKKLAQCNSKDALNNEIFIVEGDSAGGTAKMGRDRFFQAVLALRGKILNIEKSSTERIMDSEVIDIFASLGCGYGEDFDMDKLNYHKIIILTDADVDGEHIRTLLLTLFYRFAPELIYQGKVFIGKPPLYKLSYKKSKTGKEDYIYIYSDKELAEKRNEFESKNYTITGQQRYKGLGEMSASQLEETTLNPLTRKMDRVIITDKVETDNVTNLLMGSKVGPRKEFIRKESKKAKLDI